jgi:flagellar basal-body rod protein FlgB
MPVFHDPVIAALTRFLDVNVFRSELVMSNMANIDTPGYRTRDINFSQELERADPGINDSNLEYASFESAALSPSSRPVRGLMERPDGNNVSLERESLLLADTQMRFNAGVQLLRDRFKVLSSAIHEGSAS